MHFRQTSHSSPGTMGETNLSHLFVLSVLGCYGCCSVPGRTCTEGKLCSRGTTAAVDYRIDGHIVVNRSCPDRLLWYRL